jgi:hypothetical protein
MTPALIRVMALRQEEEGSLCGPGVFFCRVAAQLLEALPVDFFFCLLLTLPAFGLSPSPQLNVIVDDADASGCRFDPAAKHLPALAPCFPYFFLRPRYDLFPMRVSVPSCSRPR